MVIIPLTAKLSWRNPPVATIVLISINCFIYFCFQIDDNRLYYQASKFYSETLAGIELPRYIEYLKEKKGEKLPFIDYHDRKDKQFVVLLSRMEKDGAFQKKLLDKEIITPSDPEYFRWIEARTIYKSKLSRVFFVKYGFIPSERNLLTAVTHMFLHGGVMHLVGNMVFLWLVGCVLELGCGRITYLAGYLITGLVAVGLFFTCYQNSPVPLVGASGAISGLMGAYTVLYGKRKIRVFYSLGFYFNYAKVRAILILPLWIGNELFQLSFGGDSQIAYMAHVGGLLGGALLAYLNLKLVGHINHEAFQEDHTEEIASGLEEALQRIGKLDLEGARTLLEQVLRMDPKNLSAHTHLFNIDKLAPEKDRFHSTSERLLLLLGNDGTRCEALYDTYAEYCALAKEPQLSPELCARLASVLSTGGYPEKAEKIWSFLLRKYPKSQELPTGILNLSQAYFKKGVTDKRKKCLEIVCKLYPSSPESKIATRLLRETG